MTKRSDVVIIGGVACGPKTAATLARHAPQLKITLFEKGQYISYATCGMPYFASGDVGSFKELTTTSYDVVRDEQFFERTKDFNVFTGAEVTGIDRAQKKLTVRMAPDGTIVEHGYDKLVLATGARPNKSPFPISDSPKIRHFTKPADAIDFRRAAEQGELSSAVIIGGGFIGCELAEAMAAVWGIETTLIEKENQLLPGILDKEMSAIVRREMLRNNINIRTDCSVTRIDMNKNKPVVHLSDDEAIETDYVFLCLGVSPNTALARDCGLEIGTTGGLAVDKRMRTSDPDIFAGGDCVESTSLITGEKIYLPMGSLANRHGRLIAENILGGNQEFPGVTGAFLIKVFDINVGAVGLSQQSAYRQKMDFRFVWGSFVDKPDYYPESASFTLKMIYAANDNRLLGLQAIGGGDICRRIDVFSSFILNNATTGDLLNFEHGYAPPYSEALDPLHHLAAMAEAQKRGLKFISPVYDPVENNTFLLDVREPEEIDQTPLPLDGAIKSSRYLSIPLNDLRANLDRLDRDNNIIIICRRGPRAYQAATILQSAGFNKVSIVGGGTQAMLS